MCLQAAAAPAPSADAAAQAPSPVASAVASLASQLESGQATPALAAQLQKTQSLLEAALQVRCGSAFMHVDENRQVHSVRFFVKGVSDQPVCSAGIVLAASTNLAKHGHCAVQAVKRSIPSQADAQASFQAQSPSSTVSALLIAMQTLACEPITATSNLHMLSHKCWYRS